MCSGLSFLGRFDEDRHRLASLRAIVYLCYAGKSNIINTGPMAVARSMEITGIFSPFAQRRLLLHNFVHISIFVGLCDGLFCLTYTLKMNCVLNSRYVIF